MYCLFKLIITTPKKKKKNVDFFFSPIIVLFNNHAQGDIGLPGRGVEMKVRYRSDFYYFFHCV